MAFSASDIKDVQVAIASLDGTPYFALDLADVELGAVDTVLANAKSVKDGEMFVWMDARSAIARLDRSIVGIFAQARNMVDWNRRNRVSPRLVERIYLLATYKDGNP